MKAKPWVVGVEHPDGGAQDVAERLSLADVSIATSGNYRNVRLIDGKAVTHMSISRSHGAASACTEVKLWVIHAYSAINSAPATSSHLRSDASC